ncbi:MAG: hypothetical protein JST80_10905 [Bdellovibrionales bacterium]|nr:hypothetical protein [Bdellovibrionales bacterium]
MKIALVLLGMILSSDPAHSGTRNSIYTPIIEGSISERTWYSKSHCNKIDDTKNLISVLKTESQELGYSHCKITESLASGGHTLKRQCDQKMGAAEFVSSLDYCRSLFKK